MSKVITKDLFSLCNILYPPVTSSYLFPNILLSSLFSNLAINVLPSWREATSHSRIKSNWLSEQYEARQLLYSVTDISKLLFRENVLIYIMG
jgi:hypothetical protein